MSFATIRVETDERGVARLTLARPEKHNALDAMMIAELTEAAAHLSADTTVRVVVLAAEGPSFCAGGDLGWMRAQFDADRDTRTAEARRLAGMLGALDALPKPLIGRVQGPAYGGGVGLMAVCDAAVAVGTARFALTETRLGLIPATIGPYVLARVGAGRARRMFFSPRILSADEARSLDLVARVVPADGLDAAVEAEVLPYLSAAPGAVARAKALSRALGPRTDADIVEDTVRRLADAWEAEEAREGVSAFFEKRKPGWVGGA